MNTASEPPAVSLCTTDTVMPAASRAAFTFGVAWAMAASCQSPAASSVKMSTCPWPSWAWAGRAVATPSSTLPTSATTAVSAVPTVDRRAIRRRGVVGDIPRPPEMRRGVAVRRTSERTRL